MMLLGNLYKKKVLILRLDIFFKWKRIGVEEWVFFFWWNIWVINGSDYCKKILR